MPYIGKSIEEIVVHLSVRQFLPQIEVKLVEKSKKRSKQFRRIQQVCIVRNPNGFEMSLDSCYMDIVRMCLLEGKEIVFLEGVFENVS